MRSPKWNQYNCINHGPTYSQPYSVSPSNMVPFYTHSKLNNIQNFVCNLNHGMPSNVNINWNDNRNVCPNINHISVSQYNTSILFNQCTKNIIKTKNINQSKWI